MPPPHFSMSDEERLLGIFGLFLVFFTGLFSVFFTIIMALLCYINLQFGLFIAALVLVLSLSEFGFFVVTLFIALPIIVIFERIKQKYYFRRDAAELLAEEEEKEFVLHKNLQCACREKLFNRLRPRNP